MFLNQENQLAFDKVSSNVGRLITNMRGNAVRVNGSASKTQEHPHH